MIPIARPTARGLRDAVRQVLGDPTSRERAGAIRSRIEAADGMNRAADLIAGAFERAAKPSPPDARSEATWSPPEAAAKRDVGGTILLTRRDRSRTLIPEASPRPGGPPARATREGQAMRDIRVAAAQFEHRDADKAYNLGRIRDLARSAAARGAEVACFHECSVTAYTFLQTLTREELDALAEPVPDGPTVHALIEIAREADLVVMAGLIEREPDGRLYKSYVAVGPEGFLTRFHKLHPFISPHLTPGRGHHVVEIRGVKFGFLICYDNNLPENVRATALLGAEVIVMPHVTGCTASPMPGRGTVDPALWEARARDPARLRQEFQGPKGRGWLMRWLPARAWENGIFAVFANNIGRDHDTIKPGLAMILDPSGEVLVESHALDDDIVVALLTAEAFDQAPGRRYLRARRPELYAKLTEPHPPGHQPVTSPGWRLAHEPEKAPPAGPRSGSG